ncbi:MAG TPA: hypothetical protein VFE42_10030 [Chloroflexota bacterium]|nr:hypothetical protein [Chloroflexota bacterium]
MALYGELMEMRQREILRGLEQLQATVRTLLEEAAGALVTEEADEAAATPSTPPGRESAMAAAV